MKHPIGIGAWTVGRSRIETALHLPYLWIVAVFLFIAAPAQAHFMWLSIVPAQSPSVSSQQGRLLFGEGAGVDSDLLPDSIAAAEIWLRKPDGSREQLKTQRQEVDGNVYLSADIAGDGSMALESTCHFGQHKDFLLDYCSKVIRFVNRQDMPALARTQEHVLDLVPSLSGTDLHLVVVNGTQPAKGIEVVVTTPDGESSKQTTSDSGEIVLVGAKVGEYSFRASVSEPLKSEATPQTTAKSDSNSIDAPATTRRTYATLVFFLPTEANTLDSSDATGHTLVTTPCPPLPEAVASFGAAVADNYLYVYGGHTGKEHAHSRDNLSSHFRRVRLAPKSTWEDLPMQGPMQGLALVAHANYLYRIGGMSAKNPAGAEEDLHSLTDAARFNVQSQSWEPLASLPEGRSSHDAAILHDKLFVIGGWCLNGSSPGEWHDSMLILDPSQPSPAWTEIPSVPFRRRALTVAPRGNCIYAIGGMNDEDDVDNSVQCYDIIKSHWTEGPDLPGESMSAFGISAWTLNDDLYVAGMSGDVHRLSPDGTRWEKVASLQDGRFFHRLLPLSEHDLMLVGGATRKGHVAGIEVVKMLPSGTR